MILRNYTEKINFDPEKMKILQDRFPSFFQKNKPQSIQVHAAETAFFEVQKSETSGTINPYAGQMKTLRQPPPPEQIQLLYTVREETGEAIYSYSTAMPQALDNSGINFTFGVSSGNIVSFKHGMRLQPNKDTELLYFLYFYCPRFQNGLSPDKGRTYNPTPYLFFVKAEANNTVMSKRVQQGEWIAKIQSLSDEQRRRILTAMFKPVSESDNAFNFNTLFDVMASADTETIQKFNDLVASTSEKTGIEKAVAAPEKPIEEWIHLWIAKEKIKLVEQKSEEFPKTGWFQKAADGEGDQSIWLKTPIHKYVDGISDQRLSLSEYLSIDTNLFEKMKTRWKLD